MKQKCVLHRNGVDHFCVIHTSNSELNDILANRWNHHEASGTRMLVMVHPAGEIRANVGAENVPV